MPSASCIRCLALPLVANVHMPILMSNILYGQFLSTLLIKKFHKLGQVSILISIIWSQEAYAKSSKSGNKTAKFIFSTTRTLSIHSGTRFENVEKINNYTKIDVWPGGREWCCRVGRGRGGGGGEGGEAWRLWQQIKLAWL